ncbi:hypothetical protein HOC87_01340 [Candidatus Bathyarchaeota archaeon]|jgi:hypothetical protein|nr:hypothetical protein [Candidatus Bathyarchaeota archaeon]MBT6050335.1 hypothetical protein [Candidatus Scalindua sp.]MBT7187311.1 hypothetical protein [Candidatus Bathyarchaeota archaeon]
MKTLVKFIPLMFLLFSPVLIVSAENLIFTVPYDIPYGYVNDITISFFEDEPFEPIQVDEFPEYFFNYTVETVGWLEISIENQVGDRPVITLNGDSVYAQIDPFYREKVYIGDFFEVKMVPPRVLESSHESVQEGRIVTKYKLYSWDDMSGNILFSVIPRSEIIPDFTYYPESPVYDDSIKFDPILDYSEIDYVVWEIHGPGFDEESGRTKYVTPRLEAGKYNVTLTLVDKFGYSANITKTLVVQPEIVEDAPETGFTHLSVSNVESPFSSMINERFDVNVTLSYHISSPREIRLHVIDIESESVFSSVEGLLESNGTESYQISLLASAIPRPMVLQVNAYYNELGTWVMSESSPVFTVDLKAPEQSSEIPGFPFIAIIIGVSVLIWLKRGTW